MQYKGTLIATKDMEASKRFYHDVLGLEVVDDFGANVVLTGGIFLQTAESWKNFIHKSQGDIIFNNNAGQAVNAHPAACSKSPVFVRTFVILQRIYVPRFLIIASQMP